MTESKNPLDWDYRRVDLDVVRAALPARPYIVMNNESVDWLARIGRIDRKNPRLFGLPLGEGGWVPVGEFTFGWLSPTADKPHDVVRAEEEAGA